MQANEIKAFVPSKDYDESRRFYKAWGFAVEAINNDLSVVSSGKCSFFLQRFYNEELAKNLMLQLSVQNIEQAQESIGNIKEFTVKQSPIQNEPWGKVIYLWGPSGELWHITEYKNE